MRSYSRKAGSTSDESETGTPGIAACTARATACSCSGFWNEKSRQMATASTRSARSAAMARSTEAGSRAVTTEPSAAIRSRTSTRRAPGASQPGVSGFSARS